MLTETPAHPVEERTWANHLLDIEDARAVYGDLYRQWVLGEYESEEPYEDSWEWLGTYQGALLIGVAAALLCVVCLGFVGVRP